MSGAKESSGSMLDRIQAVEREVKQVRLSISAAKRARRWALLFVLLFVCGVGLLFYQVYDRVQSQEFQDQLLAEAQRHLELNTDSYQSEVQRLVDHASPVLMTALRTQTERDMPLYTQALNEQRDELLQNLRPQLETLVTDRYAEVLVSYEDLLAAEFPDAARPDVRDRIQNHLRQSVSRLVRRYYVASLERSLNEMFRTWDAFPPADLPGSGEPTLSQQLIGTLLEILTQQISNPPSEVSML